MSSAVTDRLRDRLAEGLPPGATLARVGLGAMLVAAGVHKLLAPEAWAVYVVDWLAPWLVVSPRLFMLLNAPPRSPWDWACLPTGSSRSERPSPPSR